MMILDHRAFLVPDSRCFETMKGVSLCLQLILAIVQVYFLCRSTLIHYSYSPNTAHPPPNTAHIRAKAANLTVTRGLDFAVIGFPKTGEDLSVFGT